MKNILLITAAVSSAVLQGCAGRTATKEETSAAQHAAEKGHVHDHPEGTPCRPTPPTVRTNPTASKATRTARPTPEPKIRTKSSFLPEQAARTDFEVQEVNCGPFRETLRCGGENIRLAKRTVGRIGYYRGVVTFVDGRVMTNSTVSAGQGLFRLSSGRTRFGRRRTEGTHRLPPGRSRFPAHRGTLCRQTRHTARLSGRRSRIPPRQGGIRPGEGLR